MHSDAIRDPLATWKRDRPKKMWEADKWHEPFLMFHFDMSHSYVSFWVRSHVSRWCILFPKKKQSCNCCKYQEAQTYHAVTYFHRYKWLQSIHHCCLYIREQACKLCKHSLNEASLWRTAWWHCTALIRTIISFYWEIKNSNLFIFIACRYRVIQVKLRICHGRSAAINHLGTSHQLNTFLF